jgi:hypothetical protein
VLAIAVMLGWQQVNGDGEALVLLPALLGIIALAELASAPGQESALVLGAALCAALLAVLAAALDQGNVGDLTTGALVGGALKSFLRYLPALLLAFGLVFARRLDRERALSPLLTRGPLAGSVAPGLRALG